MKALLPALLLAQNRLRLRIAQQRLFLCDVQPRRDAAVMPRIHQVEPQCLIAPCASN